MNSIPLVKAGMAERGLLRTANDALPPPGPLPITEIPRVLGALRRELGTKSERRIPSYEPTTTKPLP